LFTKEKLEVKQYVDAVTNQYAQKYEII
jgi:hypothetical protein